MTRQAAENPKGGLTQYRAEDLMHNPADDSGRQCRSHMKLYNSSKFHLQELQQGNG
ncbi:hypothetical protein Q5692_30460 [Microcoleus sp. C2C3]|uniref:hypothetical protein n=1 Tax=unclassified Microcoleus TaxID=2642155 RepID=UPI002FD223DD